MAEVGTLLSPESSFSAPPTDASSQVASLSSTPPTSASPDSISLASEHDTPKPVAIATPALDGQHTASQEQQDVKQLAQELELHVVQQPQSAEQRVPDLPAADSTPTALQPEPKPEVEPELEQEPELDPGQQTPAASAIIVAAEPPTPPQPPSTGRSRRARANQPVYNLAKLSGTDIHGKRRANGDVVREKRRRTTGDVPAVVDQVVRDGIDALDIDWSIPSTPRSQPGTSKAKSSPAQDPSTRRATRRSVAHAETLATKVSSLGKRSRGVFEKGLSRLSREMRRLQDTDEFRGIDKRPIVETVWSNGKFLDPREVARAEAAARRPQKKAKTTASAEAEREREEAEKREQEAKEAEAKVGPVHKGVRPKKWLEKGLYAGQEAPTDITKGLTALEKKKLAQIPELAAGMKPNKCLPMPMFNGLRLLLNGRDFKLPYDICNPLPPGQPKPAAYRTMTKNRFVGGARAYWKKTPHFKDHQSKCVCKPEEGCSTQCQNRVMLYECDDTNCNIGKPYCTNRAFQTLQERTKQGGRYRTGVEVVKTSDRGYGVRSNRCFRPHQIIMEYTGEIITEEECERRMNEVYKDNECYYLMSFDQNMIIDATTGSLARFVNHSCSPNSRMIKWIVSGQPRMALFAGDNPIMTGEELTYDYNFDPFSSKNVQKCLCGSANCRGILGPKSKEAKIPKQPAKTVKATVKAGKRKLKDFLAGDSEGDEEAGSGAAKKRKLIKKAGRPSVGNRSPVISKKRSLSSSGLKAAKGAATAIKRSVSTMSLGTKAKLSAKSGGTPRRASTGGRTKATSANKGVRDVIRTSKAAIAIATAARSPASGSKGKGRTIVAAAGRSSTSLKAGDGNKRTPKKKIGLTVGKGSSTKKVKVTATPASAVSSKKSKAAATPSSTVSAKKSKKNTPTSVTVKTTPSFTSPRRRVPSKKLLEAESVQPGSAKKSPTVKSPRKGLELSRAAKVRLVEDSD